jgi:hypothetical protein
LRVGGFAGEKQEYARGERRTCSAVLSEWICAVQAIITATGAKIIALMREEQVRLSPLECLEFWRRVCAASEIRM